MSTSGLTTIRTIGGLLPADLIGRVLAGQDLDGLTADDFHLELGVTPKEAANRSWSVLSGAWTAYRDALAKLPDGDRATSLTREKWLGVLLRELGFGRVPTTPAGGITVDGRSFPVSHEADHLPVHLLGTGVDLDRKTPGLAGAADRAPHAMVQELLNRSGRHLWAIVANGGTLRLLRDSSNLVGQAYVEFDLQAMFDGEAFSDFVALYLLAHQTRFEPVDPDAGIEDCWLERWRADAVETGTRALGQLRDGVKAAIESLGTGFLQHPDNSSLRARLQPGGELDLSTYHRSMLRLVYRLLFCFVAEDRGLLLDPNAGETASARYAEWFSTARLRRIATRRRGTRHADLWQALSITLDGLGSDSGRPELGLPGIGGLFRNTEADVVQGCSLSNDALLAAVRHLSIIQPKEGGPRRNVDYQHLGSEELGGIYESLLELVPRHDSSTRTFTLDALAGNERKTTGAHYTPTPLIDCLLEASLDHLLDEAEAAADPESAILELTVCDPAVGSGHFLVAAARRIAHRLARVRSGDDEPSVIESQKAIRDVVSRCVYGIDINPMAVELCKVSLWLEALEPGKPLGFLDHHIVNGNGLIGATPRLLADGVPDGAFTAIEGDDRQTVTARRKTSAFQRDRRNQQILELPLDPAALADPIAAEMARIERLPDDTAAQVAEKAALYRALQHDAATTRAQLAANTWCAAFVIVKTGDKPAITDDTVRTAGENPAGLTPEQRTEIDELARQYQFLHWHLAFPQVFKVDLDNGGETGCEGGFDLILGNPPWETMSPDRREFMGPYVPEVRGMSPEEQDAAIDAAFQDLRLAQAYANYRRDLFGQVHFLKNSGRYTLYAKGNLGKGDFNVYRNFVETALRNTRSGGFAAQVTPGGLYGGANASAIRHHLFDACQLVEILGLINTKRHWFPKVDIDRFAAYAARPGASTSQFRARFGLAEAADLARPAVLVPANLIRQQAPDTYAIPDLRNAFEMTVAAKMVASHPAFGDPDAGPPIRHFQTELHMGNDSGLFTTDPSGLPVYEGRMIDHFDHRAKSYVSGHGNSSRWEAHDFGDPAKAIVPQWRIARRDVPAKLGDRCDLYRIGFGDVANPRNERSFTAALIPPGVICGHKVPTFRFGDDDEWAFLPWLAVANSFSMDWLTRSRLSSPSLTFTVMDNLPFPRYERDDTLVARLAPLVLGLTCTSVEMAGYWNAMSGYGWCEAVPDGTVPGDALLDPKERADARAEIDAIVAKHVYGLTRDELSYVLDQFPVLEKRDRKAHGSYVTKDRILDWYDRV